MVMQFRFTFEHFSTREAKTRLKLQKATTHPILKGDI